ncbi:hypothetical protein [Tissierella praeacuta]|uniref:hypothetical protein n=1 Tax=Tissierella praeacuta TaxID=43131 RepID=UPI0028AFD630|nr:hypothetical protein [Tissierella praeacuta]
MIYRKWNDDEIQYLKDNYGTKNIEEIEKKLKRSRNSIFKKAKRLNLTNTMKKWKEEDINYLIEKWGHEPMEKISKQLNRSNNAIKKKAIQLQLGPSRIANGEFLTTGDIGYLLNKDPSLIYGWIKDGYIKSRKFGEKKIFQVKAEDFILFLKEHPQKWDASRARLDFIKGYLHIEFKLPDWFIRKVEYDKEKNMKKNIINYESNYVQIIQ